MGRPARDEFAVASDGEGGSHEPRRTVKRQPVVGGELAERGDVRPREVVARSRPRCSVSSMSTQRGTSAITAFEATALDGDGIGTRPQRARQDGPSRCPLHTKIHFLDNY